MTDAHAGASRLHSIGALLASADMARAFTIAALGTVFSSYAIERIAGEVAYIAMIAGLCVVGIGMLVARRREISFLRLVPTTLLVFLLWALVSLFWTQDTSSTVAGWTSTAGLALLAIVIGHVRDTLQTVRALGDVMRWVLTASLALEILSGILLDTPFVLLGIQGRIAELGPIQGLFGTRNLLGLATVLALITFFVEYRTQSIRLGVAVYSIVLAGSLAALSDSPTVFVLAIAVGAAAAALGLVRHTRPEHRSALQWSLGAVVTIGLVVAYALRHPIIAWLGAGSDFSMRATLWNKILDFVRFDPVIGFGWFGAWEKSEFPFNSINYLLRPANHASALNAYFDVLLQVGWIGLILFSIFCGIALVRAWLVASDRRSIVYAWTPLILVALLVDSMFESFTLTGFGWVMLVICAVRAGQSRSWRDRIDLMDTGPVLPHVQEPPGLSR
ncbi:O-antigen ligase family protein [Microbacterium sp. Root61]|uniref:O-antigen ligase family protein n=1 Tax=Microbacterium sp. Root61 TaxID=1736570 RepID=UPI000A9BE969|nr:O-antigen ligase family protein [Microbacterium sp. Root61]